MALSKIGTRGIADDAITTDLVANNAITTAMIASGEVGVTDLANGSITDAKVSASAAIAASKLDLSSIAQSPTFTGSLSVDTIQNASGNLSILSTQNILLKFDSDNNQTNRELNIQNNLGDQIVTITEAGTVTFAGSLVVGNTSIASNTSHFPGLTINNNGYIGTTSTNTALQLVSTGELRTVDGSVSTPAVGFANDTDTGIFRVTTNALGIAAAGSRKFYVNATNAYFQNLSRVQIDTGTFLVQNAGANVAAFHSTSPPATGEIAHIRDDYATTSQASYGAIKWSSAPGQDVYIGKRTTGTKGFMGLRNSSQQEIVTVDMLERLVGINESDPTQYHTNADDLVITGTRPGITLMCSATDRGTIHFADGTSGGAESAGFIVYRHTENPNDMLFGTDDGVRMRIQSSGVTVGNFTANALLHIGTSATGVTVGNQSTPALQIGGSNNYRFGVYTDQETAYVENKNGDGGIIFRTKTQGQAMRLHAGSAGQSGVTIGDRTTAYASLDVDGSIRYADSYLDLAANTNTTGTNTLSAGQIEFQVSYAGTYPSGTTFAFTYEATTWKSFQGEISLVGTHGISVFRFGGYWNNSGSGTVHTVHNAGTDSCAVSFPSGQHVRVTITVGSTYVHPVLFVRYVQGGGDGAPRMDRAKVAQA